LFDFENKRSWFAPYADDVTSLMPLLVLLRVVTDNKLQHHSKTVHFFVRFWYTCLLNLPVNFLSVNIL